MLIPIDNAILDRTVAQAETSPRRRMIYRYHEHPDPVQRMLNAIEPDSYIMPHKHEDPDKVEVFLALRGRALVASFTPTGEVLDCVEISPEGPNYGAEIQPRTWHAVLALEPGTVLYEVLEGPYIETTHKTFAESFAPPAYETAAGLAWMRERLAAYL